MEPAIAVALAWALFASTHTGLASPPVRGALVARFGQRGFTLLFAAVASLAWAVAVATYAAVQHRGAPGPALGRFEPARSLLAAAIALGLVLMTSALAGYARSPYAQAGAAVRQPYGVARVTRHPFFVGLMLFGAAHALLATRLVGAVAMGGLALVAGVGAWHQDRKLLALRGEPYADYLASTSALPFAAILAGRQRLAWRELPVAAALIGLALAYGLRAVHANLFDHGGSYVIGAVVGGAFAILVGEWRRERRLRASRPARAPG
jgi:uncharacterized membrane protein